MGSIKPTHNYKKKNASFKTAGNNYSIPIPN